MTHYLYRLLAVILLVNIWSAPPAFAYDANAFLKAIERTIEADGALFKFDRVEKLDDSLKVFGVSVKHEAKGERLEIQTVTFTNPNQSNGGNITYDALVASAVTISRKDGGRVEVREFSGTSLEFSDAADSDPLPEVVGNLELSEIRVLQPDADGGSFVIPYIRAANYERTGLRTFLLGSAEVASFQGRLFTPENEPADISSEGIKIKGFEKYSEYGFEIESLDIAPVRVSAASERGPVSLAFDGMQVKNYYAWDGTDNSRPLIPEINPSVEILPFEMSIGGKPVLTWDGGKASSDNDQENQISTSTASFKNLSLDIGAIPVKGPEKQNLQTLIDLGYEKISVDIAIGGYFDLKNGVVEIGKMEYDFVDAGSLDVKFRITGYTEEVARSIARLGRDISSEQDAQLQQQKSMQMLAALTPLTLNDLEISVSDNSLLGKIISVQAARLNQEPEQVAGLVAPMAGIMLAPFNVPEFAASVSQALAVFMEGGKTIRARMKPRNGLAVTEMIALGSSLQAGRMQPKELLDRLNMEIIAE